MNVILKKRLFEVPLFALFMSALQLWPGPAAQAQVAGQEHPTKWVMRCVAMPEPTPEGEVFKVAPEGKRLVGTSKYRRFSIPFAGITDVLSGSRIRYPGWDAQMKVWSAVAGVTEGRALAFFPFGVPFLLGSLAFKSRDFLLDILWEENGVEQEILLAIDKDTYASFLSELNRQTGKRWTNLEEEFARIEQELKQQAKISVRIDRKSWVAGVELKPGIYQIAFLPGVEGFGTLYFFEGQAADITKWIVASPAMFVPILGGERPSPRSPEVVARATVEVETRPNPSNSVSVLYTEENGILSVVEVHAPDKIFRLPPAQ